MSRSDSTPAGSWPLSRALFSLPGRLRTDAGPDTAEVGVEGRRLRGDWAREDTEDTF